MNLRTYRVSLRGQISVWATIEIEADSVAEAEAMALAEGRAHLIHRGEWEEAKHITGIRVIGRRRPRPATAAKEKT